MSSATALAETARALEKRLEGLHAVDGLTASREGRDLREDILLLLRSKVLPELERPTGLPILVSVQGGTNVGKSTVFNALCGKLLSPAVVQASATKHPLLFLHECWRSSVLAPEALPGLETRELGDPKELIVDAERTEIVYLRFHDDAALTDIGLIDSPDFDSALETNPEVARRVAVLADVTVFVTTAQKYRDRTLVERLRWLLSLKASIVLVFNLLAEEIVFRTLLDDLRTTVPLPDGVPSVRLAPSSAAHPEDEIRDKLVEAVLGPVRQLEAAHVKPSIIARTCRLLAEDARELAERFDAEAILKREFQAHAAEALGKAFATYERSFSLALPEETLAVRRVLSLTELGTRLRLDPELLRSSRVLAATSAALDRVTVSVRRLVLRLSPGREGSIDDTRSSIEEYARARDQADFESVLRGAESSRLALEAFFRSHSHRSAVAKSLLDRFFSTEARLAFADRLQPIHDEELDLARLEGEVVLERVESWIAQHPRASQAVGWGAIATKVVLGLALAWVVPPGYGPLSVINWIVFAVGYLLGAYGIALAVSVLLRRRSRFRAARRKAMRFVIDRALMRPLRAALDEALDERAIGDISRLAAELDAGANAACAALGGESDAKSPSVKTAR